MLALLVFIFEGIRDAFDPRKTFVENTSIKLRELIYLFKWFKGDTKKLVSNININIHEGICCVNRSLAQESLYPHFLLLVCYPLLSKPQVQESG